MDDPLQGLFTAIREACSPRAWSRGIELSRGGFVDGVEQGDDQIRLRVRSAGRTVAPVATLHVEDEEWECTCEATADCCEHVAAAIIAVRQARKHGQALPQSKSAGGTIGYRLRRDGDRLAIDRAVVLPDGTEQPLTSSIGAILAGRAQGPAIEPSKADLTIDRFLAVSRVRSFAADSFAHLVPLLAQVADVRLEGDASKVDEQPLWPRVVVDDGPGGRGFVLRLERPPELEEVVVSGLARCRGGVLRPIPVHERLGLKLERLPNETRFPPDRVAELVSRVLPEWRERTEVVVKTRRLPEGTERLEVLPVLEVSQEGPLLRVAAAIAYGNPPRARVVGDRLLHLGGAIPERHPRAERRASEKLLRELDLVAGKSVELTGAEAIAMAGRIRKLDGYLVHGDAHLRLYPERELTVEVRVRDRRIEVSFRTADGEASADATAVLDAWEREREAVPLLEGGWAELPREWLGRHGHRVRELLDARQPDGTVAAHSLPQLARLCDDLDQPRPPELDRLAPLVAGFEGIPEAPLPAGLTATLRPYQRRGVDWLCFLRDAELGAVLADDMGLGKTLEALCALRGRALVVCPRSVVHNWIDEIRRFRPNLRASVYHGTGRELDEGADVIVTTYALLRRDADALAARRWDAVVLDEAQAIKNPDSQVAQAAFRLDAAFRLALSGTPVENRLEELWSLMHFTNRGLLGGRSAFRDAYEKPIATGEPRAAERLRERIRPFVLRRHKRDVLRDLPPRSEAVLHCELESDERATYDAILLATRRKVLADLETGRGVMAALEALLRLRQAACDVALVPGSAPQEGPSSKIQRLMLALEDAAADGHKALVFSQWTSLLDRIEPHLEAAAIPFLRLDGSTVDRAGVVSAFQRDDGPPVMLLSLKAGGTGLNLTAADHVFLLDPWWNPAVEDQAADRAHRIGQERPVMIYRQVAKDTVEERILELQQHKRAIADAALGDAAAAAAITRDDLLALLA